MCEPKRCIWCHHLLLAIPYSVDCTQTSCICSHGCIVQIEKLVVQGFCMILRPWIFYRIVLIHPLNLEDPWSTSVQGRAGSWTCSPALRAPQDGACAALTAASLDGWTGFRSLQNNMETVDSKCRATTWINRPKKETLLSPTTTCSFLRYGPIAFIFLLRLFMS